MHARAFHALLVGLVWLASGVALAQGAQQGAVSLDANAGGGVGQGFLIGGHMFFYSDNSSLGGDALKDGSAVFTRFDTQYNFADWYSGLGFFYEQDSFGKEQTDNMMGLIIEITLGSFFTKIMPGYINQQFSERSFAKRSGSYLAFEAGIRANLLAGVFFYEVTLHRRTQTITQEDGRDMSDQFTKTETMPMLGMGVSL